jgi:hypothetical protein
MKHIGGLSLALLMSASASALQPLTDQELQAEVGQALLTLTYTQPSGTGTGATTSDYGFYALGLQAVLQLNTNIKNLNLGCDGANGTGVCDIKASEVSFGCVTNSSNVCIPISGSNTNTGVSSTASRTGMRDFVLTNPFLQIAIKNPNSASTREVVGIRLGADRSQGPISFGNLQSFSGYLNGTANIELQGQGRVSNTDSTIRDARNPDNVSVTCDDGYPGGCDAFGIGRSFNGTAGANQFSDYGPSFNLNNQCATVLGICSKYFDQLKVGFDAVQKNGRPLLVSGRRQTQAFISDLNLGNNTNTINGVDEVGAARAIVNTLAITEAQGLLGAGFINAVIGVLRNQIADKITQDLANGLGTTTTILNNNTYVLPYNLSNFHEAEIDSSLFGLSLQKTNLRYPGYVSDVQNGWALYLPNAIALNISSPATQFVSNITSGAAAAGNIISLQPANVNCYGSLTFC